MKYEIQKEELSFGKVYPRMRTDYIVLHHAAGTGTVKAVHNFHKKKWGVGIAYHYYVRLDGTIWYGRPEDKIGGHCGGAINNISIGVCFEGNFEEQKMTDKQYSAGMWLIKSLHEKYPDAAIVRHKDINQTACPGRFFPEDLLLKTNTEAFADIEKPNGPSAWAKQACEWVQEKGLIKGDPDGGKRWQDYITREELAVVLYRYARWWNNGRAI